MKFCKYGSKLKEKRVFRPTTTTIKGVDEISRLYSSKYKMERFAKHVVEIQFENKIDPVAWEKNKYSFLTSAPYLHDYYYCYCYLQSNTCLFSKIQTGKNEKSNLQLIRLINNYLLGAYTALFLCKNIYIGINTYNSN